MSQIIQHDPIVAVGDDRGCAGLQGIGNWMGWKTEKKNSRRTTTV